MYIDESAVQRTHRIDFRLISTTITYNNQRRATYAHTYIYIGIYTVEERLLAQSSVREVPSILLLRN